MQEFLHFLTLVVLNKSKVLYGYLKTINAIFKPAWCFSSGKYSSMALSSSIVVCTRRCISSNRPILYI